MKSKEEIRERIKSLKEERKLFIEKSLTYIDITREIRLLEWVLN